MKRYLITDHPINRADYPELVGKIVDTPPVYAIVRTVVTCCAEDLICYNFTNTCPTCDADFNMNGQRLAPRSQWGEETGEHWSDCY